MGRIFIIALLVLCYSCQKEEIILNSGMNERNVLNIDASFCPTVHCNNSMQIANLKVSLFETIENAIDNKFPLVEDFTDDLGLLKIAVVDKRKVFIRTEYLDKGIYISGQDLDTTQETTHEISYRANLIYHSDDELKLRQNHLSFEFPTVGQKSIYKFHQNFQTIELSLPDSYHKETLTVEIIDQVNENTFIIEEHLNQDEINLWQYDSTHTNIWKFEEENINIRTFDNTHTDKVFSFITGANFYSYTDQNGAFIFPLVDCTSQTLDLDNANFHLIDWNECYEVNDYQIFNHVFNPLKLYFDSSASLDGDDRFRFYNELDGIVRFIGINQMGVSTYGFDLILE